MTNRELQKLTRRELLEMLLDQSLELERVQKELEQTKQALEQRKLDMEESGSIAEAALKLNHVFEAAQQAADQYLESIFAANPERETASANAEEILCKAEQERQALLEQTRRECDEMLKKAQEECRHLQYEAVRRELPL